MVWALLFALQLAKAMNYAEEFADWCGSFGPGFRNSPDKINFRFWAEKELVFVSDKTEASILNESKILLAERLDMTRNRNAKGKAAAPKLLKIVDAGTKQGKILAHILDFSSNIEHVCTEFFAERHEVLTQLNVLARTAGIGYSVTGDTITLVMPAGVTDPFDAGNVTVSSPSDLDDLGLDDL